jgi:hypothetical protein
MVLQEIPRSNTTSRGIVELSVQATLGLVNSYGVLGSRGTVNYIFHTGGSDIS